MGSSTDQICFILKADQELSSLSIPDQAVTKCPSCKPRHNEQRTVLPYGYFFFFFFLPAKQKIQDDCTRKNKNKLNDALKKGLVPSQRRLGTKRTQTRTQRL